MGVPNHSLMLLLFLVGLLCKARCAASPLAALSPPDPRMAQTCARSAAELADSKLKELHAQALHWARWVEEELARREAALQKRETSPPVEPR